MNTKTILGLGAVGGLIYLATNKPALTKTKKAIGLSDGAGVKALTKLDKKVIMAFIDEKPADSKLLESTGKVLNGNWLGGSKIASWINGSIRLHELGSKKSDQIHKFIKKEAPKRDLE
jgi:hypothetical protein